MIKKQILMSGIQPTGDLTIGHLFGALNSWVNLQPDINKICRFMIADLHSMTSNKKNSDVFNTLAMYLAVGVDPKISSIFLQSSVPEHLELFWVLNNITPMGECMRMTQYKSKKDNVANNVGLFTYPILMASDILLYGTNIVPVGDDQNQHLQLARTLAQKFNTIYGEVFDIPEPYIIECGSRIMSLQNPNIKMSKSDPNTKSTIFLTDTNDAIVDKIKRAVTDSGNTIQYDKVNRPSISNLMEIYACCTTKSLPTIEDEFSGKMYGDFKKSLSDKLIEVIEPIRNNYNGYIKNQDYLKAILLKGRDKAKINAQFRMSLVYSRMGVTVL